MKNSFLKKSLQFGVGALVTASLSVLAGHHYPGSHRANTKKHAKKYSKKHVKHHVKHHRVQLDKHGQPLHSAVDYLPQRTPVVSVGAPNAFGPTGTVVFLSGTYVNHWRNTTADDGMINFGVSFGDPHKYVGVMVNAAFTSLGINNESFGSNGLVGLRLNRYFTPSTAVAFGVGTVDGWGSASNVSNSFYGAITHAFHLWLPMAINAGIGTGGFNEPGDVSRNKDDDVNGFVGLGVEVYRGLSIAVDYAAEQVNFGGTYTCMLGHKVPVFVSLAGKNLNERGGKAYFQATAGLAYVIS